MSSVSAETALNGDRKEIDTRFGKQDIDPTTVLEFPKGLPGFENLTAFKLFHEEGKGAVLYLQSIDDAQIQFSVVDPDCFQVNYQISLSDEETELLQLDKPEDAVVLVTLATGSGDDSDNGIHANFMGPIVINTQKRRGLQKTLNQIRGTVIIKAD